MKSIKTPYPKSPILHFNNISPQNRNNFTPIPIQIPLPLQRPYHKPIKHKTQHNKPIKTTTTSDILHLMDTLKIPIPQNIYTSLIKEITHPSKAIELHHHITKSGLPLNLTTRNRLLLMYVSVKLISHARQLFDQMLVRDFNTWAVLIAGYVELGRHGEAVEMFIRMLYEKGFANVGCKQMGFSVSGILVCVLKACVFTKDFELGKQVHCWLWKMGYSRNVVLSSFLISFYGKMRCIEGAERVFEQAGSRNTAVWTSRIVNFCEEGDFEGVVSVFKEMGRVGVRKNGYTFSNVVKACGGVRDLGFGRQVHANAVKVGVESDGFVKCALIDLYGKCGVLNDAYKLFEVGGSKRNRACCNAMLKNFIERGFCIEAMKVLYEMKVAGLVPCESVFNEVRTVCGSKGLESKLMGSSPINV